MSRTRLRRKYRFERYQPLTQQTPLMHCRPPGHIPLLQKLAIAKILIDYNIYHWYVKLTLCEKFSNAYLDSHMLDIYFHATSSPTRYNATPSHVAIISSRTAPTRTMLNWITVVRTAD
ncbi:hypothetical protein T06_14479 [Trichinella sp. T6]|nr:hypothetical protein T06_14479 [Trichinella sp. T6]